MALAGPRLCCLVGILLLGCLVSSISAEPSTSSNEHVASAGAAAAAAGAQTRPQWVAAVLGGSTADRERQHKQAADSHDSYNNGYDDAASLKSIFGLGPKDLPDSVVDPTLVATGMDSSSADSTIGVATIDAKRNRKAQALATGVKRHYRDFGSADAGLNADADGAYSSNGHISEAELLQAFDDAEQEENQQQQKQHHRQHHKPKGLAWVLGRRSAKQAGSDGQKGKDSTNGARVGVAFVENRLKPLLAAIKSKAPNLGHGGQKSRKYTRAEVEDIVKIMSAELKGKQGQQGADFDAASSSSSSSSSDNSVPRDSFSSGSSSSSDIYAQDSGDAYDDGYADARFKDHMTELRHHKRAPTAAADAAAADTVADSTLGAGSEDSGLLGGDNSAALSGPDVSQQPKGARKTTHTLSAAYSDAKKQVKARRSGHAAHMAGMASSKESLAAAKAKHKKPHSPAAATAAAKRAAHKASHAKRQQFLDAQEMEDIKTILEAIYDKENAGFAADVTGEEAATLAEIQAALQPHIITDDPAAFSLTFNADDNAGSDSIPSEQPAAQQEPAPTPSVQPHKAAAPLGASAPKAASDTKKAPAAAATPPAKKPAAKAPAADNQQPAAVAKDSSVEESDTGAAAEDSDADEDTEVVYIEEEVEYVETEDADEAEADLASADDSDVEFEYIEVDADSDVEGSEAEVEVEAEASGDAEDSKHEAKGTSSKSTNADKMPTEKDNTEFKQLISSSDKAAKDKSAVKDRSQNAVELDSKQSTHKPETKPHAPQTSTGPSAASSSSKSDSAPSSSSGSSGKADSKASQEQEEEEGEQREEEQQSHSKAQSHDSKNQADKPAPAVPAAVSSKQHAAKHTSPIQPAAPAAAAAEQGGGEEEEEEGANRNSTPATKANAPSTGPVKSAPEDADSCTGSAGASISNCAMCTPPLQGVRRECQYCKPGFFRESPVKCTVCPKGAWCAGGEVMYCKEGFTTAEPGRWNEQQCDLCAAGFGATRTSGTGLSCSRCSVGTYASQASVLPCQHCPPLTMSIDLVSTGKFGEAGSACLACPAGLVPDETNTDCRCPASNRACACPKGWVSRAGNASPPCVKCGAGNTYAAVKKDTGVKACVACPRNSVATDGLGCICKPGFFSRDGTPFVEGGCAACPVDSHSAMKGSSSCLKCAPNTAPNAERTECVQQQ